MPPHAIYIYSTIKSPLQPNMSFKNVILRDQEMVCCTRLHVESLGSIFNHCVMTLSTARSEPWALSKERSLSTCQD